MDGKRCRHLADGHFQHTKEVANVERFFDGDGIEMESNQSFIRGGSILYCANCGARLGFLNWDEVSGTYFATKDRPEER